MKPKLELKNVWHGQDSVTFTFNPIGMNIRGVSSAYTNLGGEFVVTVQFDKETESQTKKRKRGNANAIASLIDVMSVKPKSGNQVCPKCKKTSGDDWSQCGKVCPMPMSPHYKG